MSNLKKFEVGADLCICYDNKLQSEVEENVFKEGAYERYEFLAELGYNEIYVHDISSYGYKYISHSIEIGAAGSQMS